MKVKGRSDIPDLDTQLESLFDQVWRSEADWLLWDRIDASVEQDVLLERRKSGPNPNLAADLGPAQA
jgi:hypothetical protein